MATLNSTTGQTGAFSLYDEMLLLYLPERLLEAELVKRNWLLSQIKKKNDWKGGDLKLGFESSKATSVAWGKLPSQGDIASFGYKQNTVSGYKEVWGSMVFYHKDLIQHDANDAGKQQQARQSFLSALTREIPKMTMEMSQKISMAILNGGAAANVTSAANAATGKLVIDRIDRVQIGEKVTLSYISSGTRTVVNDANGNPQGFYVNSININTGEVGFKSSMANVGKSGGDANFSSAGNGALQTSTADKKPQLHYDGAENTGNQFVSLRDQLLSSANGGSDMWFSEVKTNQPFSQAVEISGSSWSRFSSLSSPGDFLTNLFNAEAKAKRIGYAMPRVWVMSYANIAEVKKNLEAQKGSYKMLDSSVKTLDAARSFTWEQMLIGSVTDSAPMMFVTVQEMPDDLIYGLDISSLKLYTNGFIRRHRDPNGNTFTSIRDSADGFQYILDFYMFGEFVVCKPCNNIAVHSLPASTQI